jgi:hypothetical protein
MVITLTLLLCWAASAKTDWKTCWQLQQAAGRTKLCLGLLQLGLCAADESDVEALFGQLKKWGGQ